MGEPAGLAGRLLIGLGVSGLAGAIPFAFRFIDTGGWAVGVVLAAAVWACAGPSSFMLLAITLALAFAATLIASEPDFALLRRDRERRGAAHALANLGIGCFLLTIGGALGWPVSKAAGVAALAAAAADTAATEVGRRLGARPVHLVPFRSAVPGEKGAVSSVGLAAALAVCAIVAVSAAALGQVTWPASVSVCLAALLATLAESALHSCPGLRLGHHQANVSNTALAAAMGAAFAWPFV